MTEIVMDYTEDPRFVEWILEQLHLAFGQSDRTGIHISDLVHCLKKAFYARQPDYLGNLTDDSVLYFVRGRSLHDMIEKLFPNNEVTLDFDGIIGNVDAMGYFEGVAIAVEIKTTKQLRNGPYDSAIAQLKYYMSMSGKNIGYLLYYEYFTNKIRAFKFVMDDELRKRVLKELKDKKDLLLKALEIDEILLLSKLSDFECNMCQFLHCDDHPSNY